MRDPFDVISNYQTKELCLAFMGLKRIHATDDIENEIEAMLETQLRYQLEIMKETMEEEVLGIERKKNKNQRLLEEDDG